MKARIVEREAECLVHTSVHDALSGVWNCSVVVLKRAIQLEQKSARPRVALIRGLQAEIRKKERAAATAPKDAA